MKRWQIAAPGIDNLQCDATDDLAGPGPGEVLVRMRANAINFRDLQIVRDPLARGIPAGRVPNSDGAGEIVAIGPDVTGWQIGDRVASCFFQRWSDGDCSAGAMASALGGAIDGVLAETVRLRADGIVAVPPHLDAAQAATLPCAGLTAWRAVVEVGKVKPGQTVLLLGTGGVSIFALQFATLIGARAIITSSSDEKLERARALGAWQTVNYRQRPDWEQAVLDATDGQGVDLTVETGGGGTLARSVACTRIAGTIGLIGVLSGGTLDPTLLMRKSIVLQGIYVGSRRMFEDMNRAIAAARLQPVIDRRFDFDQAPDAYRAMQAAGHFGKLVIAV